MKKFFKYTLATIVGIIIFNIIGFLFWIILLVSMTSSDTVIVKDNSILKITLGNLIQDRASTNPLDNFDLMSMTNVKSSGLNKIIENIEKAGKDDRIKGIYLELTDINANFGGMASTEEIRNALKEFKKSGKFIYSYTNLGYSQKAYFLASVADSIFVNPETPLGLVGLSSQNIFFKNVLDKLGVKSEVVKVGKYKSAVEPFLQTSMSKENREQVQKYLNSTWNTMLAGISEGRNISVEELNKIADNFDMRMPQDEAKLGLFDGVIYEDEIIDFLKDKCGVDTDKKLSYVDLDDYVNAPLTNDDKKFSKDKIAVLYAAGDIVMEQSNTTIGVDFAKTVREARQDKNVKAIVMRVNSPGGSVLTSDIIWREVKLAAKEKPFIVSMGNVAASGGYYISCPATVIVADPTTLTGSIGVFGLLFSGEKLIKDKIGITSEVVKTNEHGDFGGVAFLGGLSDRSFTDYERNVMQNYVNNTYDSFLSKVSEGRGMTKEAVHEIAQGRVWTGEDAIKIGLVDTLGGLNDAIKIAADKAGLTEYRITELPTEKSPFEEIFSNFSASVKGKMLKEELGVYYDAYRQLNEFAKLPQGVLARMPYNMTIE
ncbi:MAG: signal peptide peptidase SppA [Culturomica sp.]|jgi:protease-4|nr:signal peptide peptidase SppA [Culturomica sp.]